MNANCHGEIEPYASLDNDGTGSPDDTEHHRPRLHA